MEGKQFCTRCGNWISPGAVWSHSIEHAREAKRKRTREAWKERNRKKK